MLLDYNVELTDYEIIEKIGQGNFSNVYKVKNKNDSMIYAAKESKERITEESDELKGLMRKLQINSQINHPSIAKFIGFSKTNFHDYPNPILITEYVPNNSLDYYINSLICGTAPPESETQKIIIIYGIASAMAYLHSHDILHRDLKPANILLDDSFYPKICNFGLFKKETAVHQGIPFYLSPEILKDNNYTKAGDVYAFGLIVYQLILNKIPFNDIIDFDDLVKEVTNGERPPIERTISTSFQQLIESCWAQEPENRPSFSNIVGQLKDDHGFISNLIDKDKYYGFVDYIDKMKTSFVEMPILKDNDYKLLKPEEMYKYAQEKEAKHKYEKARHYYKIAASTPEIIKCMNHELRCCRDAMVNYARMCKEGLGGPANLNDYVEYLKRAANFNLARAQYKYGLLLEKGEFVDQNIELAVFYFKSAADADYTPAIFKCIFYFSKGIGVKKNVFYALKYCKKLKDIKSKRHKNDIDITNDTKPYQNVLSHINDVNITNNEIYENDDNINMKNGFITFQEKQYKNDLNWISSGSKSLDEQLVLLEKNRSNVYPQGFDYCKNLLIQQKNVNGTVMICNTNSEPKMTTFYFELPFDEGRHLLSNDDIQIEIDMIKHRRHDIYPQGKKYVLDLLNEKRKENESIRVLSRKASPSVNVLYYFKSSFIMKYKDDKSDKSPWERVFYVYTKDINKEINKHLERRPIYYFPDGYEEFMKTLEQKRDNNENVIIISNTCKDKKVKQIFDSKMMFESFCDQEYVLKSENDLRKEIDKLKFINELNEKCRYTTFLFHQKIDPVQLIEEQIKNKGKIRVLIRKNNFFDFTLFYFKA